jgi:hypothetical protein
MAHEDRRSQLQEWLEEFVRYGVEPLRRLRFSEANGQGKVIFCTATTTFAISFSDTYLGCVASSRIQRAGERWTRGSDLPDGAFSREVFDKIMQAVIGYEMVDLAPVVEPMTEPEAVLV